MYVTEGIILKKIDVGETDALFSIYTKDFGKIIARAQGIKKEEAKLKGHLETLHLSAIQFVLGKNGARLIGASLLNPWQAISADFDKTTAAMRMADTFDRHCFPNDCDESLWNILYKSFLTLEEENLSFDDVLAFFRSFEEKFSIGLGYSGAQSAENYGMI